MKLVGPVMGKYGAVSIIEAFGYFSSVHSLAPIIFVVALPVGYKINIKFVKFQISIFKTYMHVKSDFITKKYIYIIFYKALKSSEIKK